jgi:hypothetical protein
MDVNAVLGDVVRGGTSAVHLKVGQRVQLVRGTRAGVR